MTLIERGPLVEVIVKTAGSAVAADTVAGVGVLPVKSAVDFSEDGGTAMVGEVDHLYSGVEGSNLLLAEPLAADVEVGDSVTALTEQGTPNETWWARVQLDEDDPEPVSAFIDSDLRAHFRPGDGQAGALVEVVSIGNSYRVQGRPIDPPTLDAPLRLSDEDGNVGGGVNSEGDVSGRDLSYAGSFLADLSTMLWDGETAADMLALLPKGLLRWGNRPPSVAGIGNSEYAVLSLMVYVPRDCEADILLTGRLEANAANARFDMRVRHTYALDDEPAPADNSSPLLTTFDGLEATHYAGVVAGVAGEDQGISVIMPAQLTAGWYNFRWTLRAFGTDTLTTINDFGMRVYDRGPANLANGASKPLSPGSLSSGGSDTGANDPPEKQYYTKTYQATDTKWWTGGGDYGGDGENQYFGNTSATGEGNRKSVIWFDKSKIRSDLRGGTVEKVELYLYLHNGGRDNKVAIGSHNDTSPGSNSYGDVDSPNRQRQVESNWHEGSGRWVTIDFDKQEWKDVGGIAGFVIGPASSDSDAYAAGYRGMGHAKHPQLRIRFSK